MRLYTVHIRHDSQSPDREAVLVKQGFAWPAFFFRFLWALFHRMWIFAAAILVIEVALFGALEFIGLDELSVAVIGLGWDLLLGAWGNDLRRLQLRWRGYEEIATVAGRNLAAAEHRLFDNIPLARGAAA
jgi:hypothetical protein